MLKREADSLWNPSNIAVVNSAQKTGSIQGMLTFSPSRAWFMQADEKVIIFSHLSA